MRKNELSTQQNCLDERIFVFVQIPLPFMLNQNLRSNIKKYRNPETAIISNHMKCGSTEDEHNLTISI